MFDVFFNSVKNAGDTIAIILTNKEKLSYTQMAEVVDAWARYFIAVGVQQGDRVAVLTDHEDLHPFLHLALDKINATVVPLDSDIPTAQLELDLKTLALKKIVIDEALCQRYAIPETIKLYAPASAITPPNMLELASVCLPFIERKQEIPNYIVASSGTTDNKKWIPIGSAGLTYWAEIEKNLLHLSSKDKILCTRSPAYDARISEYVRSFAAGSTLVLLSHSGRRDFNTILEQCGKEEITCLILIASQLAIVNLEEVIQRLANAGLIHLMVTGDACTMRLKRLCEQYQINLWNCYGPTEATFGMSILCVNHEEVEDDNQLPVVPIGLPHSREVKFHLIDECLYIESPFLSDGYIHNPVQTQKNFPILQIEGRPIRVFNTENRFALKNDKLIFKGRITNEAHCKVSGVKVEPYAIQQCLEKYNDELGKDVLQVYVVVKPWLNNQKPFAYIVVQHDFSKVHFMAFIKKWLRKEEIPIIIALSDFPRLIPSEKIDRRALIERTDHPDEFFFNEGLQNKQKFSRAGTGLDPELEQQMKDFVFKIKDNQIPEMEEKELFIQIDRLVLAANHLDQTLNAAVNHQNIVLNWLTSAYVLLGTQYPKYCLWAEAAEKELIFASYPIASLSALAQLLHYYGKALRYCQEEPVRRNVLLKKAIDIAAYLEEQSSPEDAHAFRGRLLTYNLSLMLCLRDQGHLLEALALAQQQSLLATEKQELFLVIQFESYIADILLRMSQPVDASKHAKEAFLLAKKFYNHKIVYFNAAVSYIKSCLQNKEEVLAGELALDILNAHAMNPLCGAKSHHLQEARETLRRVDPLTQIWAEVLGINQCDEQQEFMFLGGDSFLLTQLLRKIQRTLDPTYTYQELINLPSLTLMQIRSSLTNKQHVNQDMALAKPLFQIVPQRNNYFFLPPLLGEGYFTYKELAKIFFSHYKFNIYGLSDPSLSDERFLPKSLEDAASRYVNAIRKIQPKGPYNLLGFSYGGTLAYYVAKELLAQGEQIKALHLVDGFPPALYQRLSAKEHAKLLEELINFVIQTLNNRFYDEGLKAIRLVRFDKLTPKEQVNTSFRGLLSKVKKQSSRLLLMLARQHLLFMLESKEPNKLPLWAELYLSTPNQTYLNVIYRIHNIVKRSADCQSYYWNHYFQEVNLVGNRVQVKHLDLLRPQSMQVQHSAHLFWQRAHDPLFNFPVDYLALKPFYSVEKLNEEQSVCHVYSLSWQSLIYYKNTLADWPQIINLYAYPLYERISEKYECKDRLFTTKYVLSFIIHNDQLVKLHQFFDKKVKQYTPENNSAQVLKQLVMQIIDKEEQQSSKSFFINLDIYWNGGYLMSLYFNCHADYKALLRKIFIQTKIEIDKFSDFDNDLYNLSHFIVDLSKPSIFDAINEISTWLNQFMTLLIPPVKSHSGRENRMIV